MPATTVRKALGDLTNVGSATHTRKIGGRLKDGLLNVTRKQVITKKSNNHRQVGAKKSSLAAGELLGKTETPKSSLSSIGKKPEVSQTYTRLLPEGVEDIDTKDRDNIQACSEYAVQIYSHLRQLEGQYRLPMDFLLNSPVTGRMRAVLADWIVQAHQQFKLQQETLFLTMSILDRYLARESRFVFKSQLQLVGVAAMFIASKIEEIFAPDVADFVYITDDTYTGDEVRHMELKILAALNWDFSAPLSLNFLRRFSRAGDVGQVQHALAKFILELGLQEYSLISVAPTKQAAASLHLALQLLDPPAEVWGPSLQYYSGYTTEQLTPTVSILAGMLGKAPESKLQAVRTKYKDGKFHRVSCLPQLDGKSLGSLKHRNSLK